MYLKSFEIKNFRKFFGSNIIEFVDSKTYNQNKRDEKLDIAPITTLIVGKNNCGKTTVITALEKLINKSNMGFNSNDFNYSYLKNIITDLESDDETSVPLPRLEFVLTIGIEDSNEDIITNLIPLMKIGDVEKTEVKIKIKIELENEEIFRNNFRNIEQTENETLKFNDFLNLLDQSTYKINYFNAAGDIVKNFKISDLIELRSIKANNIKSEYSLSKAFSKIINYRYKLLLEDNNNLEKTIKKFNVEFTSAISEKHTNDINQSLGEIESSDKLKVLLSADLTFEKMMSNLIKYNYVEKNTNIPENQFGLGYTNLMMIIADLIDYMEKYPDSSFNSKVNLISIEEPETFMHPHMQELFITNINNAVQQLLKSKNKNVNSQLIISTHSSHILNSKIHSGNTFNNINYITSVDSRSCIVKLHDDIIIPQTSSNDEQLRNNNLKFLKKHIKYKVSELFFSDAVIFVEGVTEETLLKYYIEKNSKLNKSYISIFNIDGAHGLVYHNLINLLLIPALIITDLDIKRNDQEKANFKQITDLTNRTTTNKTIKKYNEDCEELTNIKTFFEKNNMYITYQGEKIGGYYATSFEEAFILKNYENTLFNNVLNELKPNVYSSIVRNDENKSEIKKKSFKLQKKLSNSKSDFANLMLYALITEQHLKLPDLPDYIQNGLNWLENKLEREQMIWD